MKIERGDLLAVLDKVRPGLAQKAILEQATHFIFSGDDVIAYNDFVSIIHPFKTDFICSVPAEEFYKIIKNLPNQEIYFELKENKLGMKAGKTRASIKTQTGDDILTMIEDIGIYDIKDKDYAPLPKDFIAGLGLCLFSASTDMSDPRFTGIFINEKTMTSTDSLRASQYKMKSSIGGTFLLPANYAQDLIRYSVIEFVKKDWWVFFRTEKDMLFCIKILDHSEYPDIEDLLDFDGIEIELPDKTKDAVNLALIMAKGETDAEMLIDVEITAKSIRCRGENERGWIENELDTALKLDRTIGFEINPGFLLKIMEHTHKMVYVEGRAKFETENFSHAVSIRG